MIQPPSPQRHQLAPSDGVDYLAGWCSLSDVPMAWQSHVNLLRRASQGPQVTSQAKAVHSTLKQMSGVDH